MQVINTCDQVLGSQDENPTIGFVIGTQSMPLSKTNWSHIEACNNGLTSYLKCMEVVESLRGVILCIGAHTHTHTKIKNNNKIIK